MVQPGSELFRQRSATGRDHVRDALPTNQMPIMLDGSVFNIDISPDFIEACCQLRHDTFGGVVSHNGINVSSSAFGELIR